MSDYEELQRIDRMSHEVVRREGKDQSAVQGQSLSGKAAPGRQDFAADPTTDELVREADAVLASKGRWHVRLIKRLRDRVVEQAEVIRTNATLEAELLQEQHDRKESDRINIAFANGITKDRDKAWAEIASLRAQLAEKQAEIESLAARLAEEKAIVDRIWTQLGSPTYEQLKGRSIYDLIAESQKDAERLDWLDANPQVIVRSGKQYVRPLIDAAMKHIWRNAAIDEEGKN